MKIAFQTDAWNACVIGAGNEIRTRDPRVYPTISVNSRLARNSKIFQGGKSAGTVGLPLLALYRKDSSCQVNRACRQKTFQVGNVFDPSHGGRPVHFFVMSTIAKYSIFSRLSSVGKTDLAFVTLRSYRLKLSNALVVIVVFTVAQFVFHFAFQAIFKDRAYPFLEQFLHSCHIVDSGSLQHFQ